MLISSLIFDPSRKYQGLIAGTIYLESGENTFNHLLKEKTTEVAFDVAEQLRKMVAETASPTGEPITISLGISSSREEDQHPEETIKRADTALFQSKTDGRHRTTCYNETCDALLSS